jgi:hypothetical protein
MPELTKPNKEVPKELAAARTKLQAGFLQALKDLGGSATTHQIRKKLELPHWTIINDSEIRVLAFELKDNVEVDTSKRIFIYKLKSD